MEGIQVSVSKAGVKDHISVIKVGGYIDTTTSAELERALGALLKAGNYNIIIDLGNVDYISSAGWGIFISEIKGIREKGGDLKLVNMIPDVYEVFELLEFHYILKAFNNLEEAVRDFELNSQLPAESTVEQEEGRKEAAKVSAKAKESVTTPESTSEEATIPVEAQAEKITPIEEKIRKLILENPDIGILQLKKTLNTERYGFTKIGILELWKLLRKMGLATKKQRVTFFKKQAFKG
ncbi:hypothetical protein DRQ15_08810 [candidate division KSB1 bacterium]|nr:MAG: hypothetical protein DRQ15_08810 [candidate division KSB1 bacterium]